MDSTNRPLDRMERVMDRPAAIVSPAEYHDRIRWGPIIAGLVVAISSQLVLSAIGAAIGLSNISGSGAPRSDADDVGSAVGIWSMISLFISLFIGGWVTARSCGPITKATSLLNGAVLWATTLALSAWLLTNGVSGLFGWVANNADTIVNQVQQGTIDVPNQAPNVTAQQTRDIAGNAAKLGWSFGIGSLLGLVSSMIGASVGTRRHRTTTYTE